MEKIITSDNAVTFFSEEYQEAYHSKTGAVDEAFKKFAEPSKIAEINTNKITILDICFGLGYNSFAGIKEALKNDNIKEIEIIGVELDPIIISKAKEVDLHDEVYETFKIAIEKRNSEFEIDGVKIKLNLLVKDARDVVRNLDEKYSNTINYVFLDPFSPKKCPVLWTEEFFTNIYKLMKTEGILTTYSCARVVRDNLRASNFEVTDGPKVQRRGPSTIARKV